MIIKKFFIIFFIAFLTTANADNKENILNNLKKTNNFSFKFEQNINDNIEIGSCVVKYPKKIFCNYEDSNNKILVSNGKSLVIKTITSYYRYPLNKTPLEIILDKNLIINKIYGLKEETSSGPYIHFKVEENNNEIEIFFDKLSFHLVGWQTKDIYQNLNSTYLNTININQEIDENLFKLPLQN
tara:strand:+ start:252 stop:803 length:552 start_codon:yes stop_codon:yes gene_type:complete